MCCLMITESDQLWKLPEILLNKLGRQIQQGRTEASDWKNMIKPICYLYLIELSGFNKPVICILPYN